MENIDDILKHHWALDNAAAVALDIFLEHDMRAQDHLRRLAANLDPQAALSRDVYREDIGKIFTGKSDKKLVIIGPCSLDKGVDYGPLFEFIAELQQQRPDCLIAFRGNGAKPRTSTGWRGAFNSLDPIERHSVFKTLQQAFDLHIPVVTEITETEQLAALAPWLSGVWIGARDIEPTERRDTMSAYHLPVGIKNSTRGNDEELLTQAHETIRGNSILNDNSGVFIGNIGRTALHPGIATPFVPVEQGNDKVALFARGHVLPEGLTDTERRNAAFLHLSRMCLLGNTLGSAVLLDATHGVPPMLDIDRKGHNRVIHVLDEMTGALNTGRIAAPEQLRGVIAEIGVNTGRTDPNFLLAHDSAPILRNCMELFLDAL